VADAEIEHVGHHSASSGFLATEVTESTEKTIAATLFRAEDPIRQVINADFRRAKFDEDFLTARA